MTAVEVDPRMIALLGETLADHKNVQVIQADALKVDLLGIAARHLQMVKHDRDSASPFERLTHKTSVRGGGVRSAS